VLAGLAELWKQKRQASTSPDAAATPPAPKDKNSQLLQVGDRVLLYGPDRISAAEGVVKVVGTGSLLINNLSHKVSFATTSI
jgi:chitodextrinase